MFSKNTLISIFNNKKLILEIIVKCVFLYFFIENKKCLETSVKYITLILLMTWRELRWFILFYCLLLII